MIPSASDFYSFGSVSTSLSADRRPPEERRDNVRIPPGVAETMADILKTRHGDIKLRERLVSSPLFTRTRLADVLEGHEQIAAFLSACERLPGCGERQSDLLRLVLLRELTPGSHVGCPVQAQSSAQGAGGADMDPPAGGLQSDAAELMRSWKDAVSHALVLQFGSGAACDVLHVPASLDELSELITLWHGFTRELPFTQELCGTVILPPELPGDSEPDRCAALARLAGSLPAGLGIRRGEAGSPLSPVLCIGHAVVLPVATGWMVQKLPWLCRQLDRALAPRSSAEAGARNSGRADGLERTARGQRAGRHPTVPAGMSPLHSE